MATDPPAPAPAVGAPQPEPKKPSAVWKWLKRIGCVILLLTFTCCGLTCTGGWWLERSVRNMNKDEVDRIHADGMQNGDVQAMFERANPKFRGRFNLQDLEAFLEQRPGILGRDNLRGVDFARMNIDGAEFVKVKSKRSMFSFDEWEIVFKVVDGVLELVGISPGMDEFVPAPFRYRRSSGGGWRRHHH